MKFVNDFKINSNINTDKTSVEIASSDVPGVVKVPVNSSYVNILSDGMLSFKEASITGNNGGFLCYDDYRRLTELTIIHGNQSGNAPKYIRSINGVSLPQDDTNGEITIDASHIKYNGTPLTDILSGHTNNINTLQNTLETKVVTKDNITAETNVLFDNFASEVANKFLPRQTGELRGNTLQTDSTLNYQLKGTITGPTINTQNTITAQNVETNTLTADGTITAKSNIDVKGKVQAAQGVYDTSDRNKKENITDISDTYKLSRIDLKEFNLIGDPTKKYGIIAQDAENAGLGNIVYTNEYGEKSVDYVSFLILKVKQLEDEINKLKAKEEVRKIK